MLKVGVVLVAALILGIFLHKLTYKSNTEIPSEHDQPLNVKQDKSLNIVVKDKNEKETQVEISELKLSFTVPSNWRYNVQGISKSQFKGREVDKAQILLENDKGKIITIIPNFQGGWCEGPNSPKKETLQTRFNLPGIKFTCGSVYYIYGDLNIPGSIVPNLFISVSDDSDKEINQILSSLNYSIN